MMKRNHRASQGFQWGARGIGAQSLIEYAMVLAIVAAAFGAMHLYLQRAAQANLKLIQDKINAQEETHLTLGFPMNAAF
jgi:hypothetical protein